MNAVEGTRARVRRGAHLVSRFFSSLRARAPDPATVAWVAGALEPAELRVWETMGRADRAESVEVARRLEVALEGTSEAGDTCWTAAALLHDAGKQLTGYGTIGRATVTVVAVLVGNSRVRGWAAGARPTMTQPVGSKRMGRERMGRYVAHDELGAARLREVGARAEVGAWADAHHRPDRWSRTGIPLAVCRALAVADGEPPREWPRDDPEDD